MPPKDSPSWTAPGRAVRASLGSVVVETLVDQIVGGHLVVGTVLPSEADLGAQLGVSRPVVRESVKALESKGLLQSRQGVGTVVRERSDWDLIDGVVLRALVRHDESMTILDDLVIVRAALETALAEQAGARVADDGSAAISAAYDRMAASLDEPEVFARADVEFHDSVMALSGNRLGRAVVTSIHEQARTTGRYHGVPTRASLELTLREHRAVLDAIDARDGIGAAAAMRAHILGSWDRRRPLSREGSTTSR